MQVNSRSINSKKSTMDNQVVQFALGRASEKGLVGHGNRIIVSALLFFLLRGGGDDCPC